MGKAYSKAAAATFKLNKGESIHRGYSYLEGYSSCLIDDIIMEIGPENIRAIYDPFCGTGTTSLVASSYGIKSYYCETNPFMQKVIEAKINCVKRLRDSGVGSKYLGFTEKHSKVFFSRRFSKQSAIFCEKTFKNSPECSIMNAAKNNGFCGKTVILGCFACIILRTRTSLL